MLQLLLLLLPLAAISGWFFGYRRRKAIAEDLNQSSIPAEYFIGLNYLINEEPDKAVDVFIKMVEVNDDTVETHLALGNLFRRRGEVDRAIRIHQNLIARPKLSHAQKMDALLELAQDYLRAGVFDRAEKLFLELIDLGGDLTVSLISLLNIYQQQRDWQQAIATAKKLHSIGKVNLDSAIAHYYCELAEQMTKEGQLDVAKKYLKDALHFDKYCARANILLGGIFFQEQDYQHAIKTFNQVYDQDEEYVPEILDLLAKSYRHLGLEEEFVEYLTKRIEKKPRGYYILAMVDYLLKKGQLESAINYLTKYAKNCLSLRGLSKMLALYIDYTVDIAVRQQLVILQEFVSNLLKSKPVYRCVSCGFAVKNLYWQCPSCRKWNSIKPIHGLEGD